MVQSDQHSYHPKHIILSSFERDFAFSDTYHTSFGAAPCIYGQAQNHLHAVRGRGESSMQTDLQEVFGLDIGGLRNLSLLEYYSRKQSAGDSSHGIDLDSLNNNIRLHR